MTLPISHPACLLGTLIHADPTGLGPHCPRLEQGNFVGIVEEKDATEQQRKINEVNMSTYVFDCQHLLSALDQLTDDNQQKEYYITDVPGILLKEGQDVRALAVLKPDRSPQRQHCRTLRRCRTRTENEVSLTDA